MRGTELVTQQLQYAVEQAMNIGADITRQLVRHQQAIDQILQAVSLGDDDLGVLNQLRRGEFTLKQLCGTAQTTQRIFDLVRKVANQLTISLILLGDFCFASDLLLLIDVAEFDDQTGIIILLGFEESGGAIDQ